ncbi:MAG: TfoX/Sxy family protein [Nitrospirota bacterium]
MAFDDQLSERIRKQLRKRRDVTEKTMFGGLAFLVNGNMCCGVHGLELIVRLPADEAERALSQPYTRIFDLSGRPMKGWILVQAKGLADDRMLAQWVDVGVRYAASLPEKKK